MKAGTPEKKLNYKDFFPKPKNPFAERPNSGFILLIYNKDKRLLWKNILLILKAEVNLSRVEHQILPRIPLRSSPLYSSRREKEQE